MDHSFKSLHNLKLVQILSAGTATRNTYKLTGGNGLQQNDRKNIIDSLCAALQVQFEDTVQGLISATSIGNFKIWPMDEEDLEGFIRK